MSSAAIANAGMIQRSQLVEAEAAATPERRVSSSVRATDAAAARVVLPPAMMALFAESPSESMGAVPPSILPKAGGIRSEEGRVGEGERVRVGGGDGKERSNMRC